MNRSYKICLIIAVFFVTASAAWAGFNYDSAHNYFLIDSILKSEGDYILVGDALSGSLKKADGTNSTNFFAVSNNLIFLDPNGTFSSGGRQMNNNYFSTPGITVKGTQEEIMEASANVSQDFLIRPLGGVGALSLSADTIKMNQDFKINNGLNITDGLNFTDSPFSNYTINVNKVLTSQLILFPGTTILNFSTGTLNIGAGGSATLQSGKTIKIGTDDLCRPQTIPNPVHTSPGGGGDRTDCLSSYLVFTANSLAQHTAATRMVCCKYKE